MSATHFFGSAFFGGEFFAQSTPTVIIDTHDGFKKRRRSEEEAEEFRKRGERLRADIVEAIDGKPAVEAQIAALPEIAPYVEPQLSDSQWKALTERIAYEQLLEDAIALARVERIIAEAREEDDIEGMLLSWR